MASGHPLIMRQQNFAAKAETTAGTAVALTAAEGVFNHVGDVTLEPDIPANERQSPGSMSYFASAPGGSAANVEVTCEYANSGSSTPPQWFSCLLAASGFSIATFAGTVQSGSASAVTTTAGLYIDGILYTASGVQYDVEATFEAGKTVPIKFTGKGVWQTPADTALIAPTYDTAIAPTFQAATLTIAGATILPVPRVVWKMNNDVQLREDGTNAKGYKASAIVNRNPTFEMDIEAALLATQNWFTYHSAKTEAALSLAIGTGTNNVLTLAAPKLQLRTPPRLSPKNGILYYTLMFGANKSAAAGDDEITLTLS